jgi:hypothetical protein
LDGDFDPHLETVPFVALTGAEMLMDRSTRYPGEAELELFPSVPRTTRVGALAAV